MTGDVVAGEVSRLGWRAQRRPRPGFAHVLGAAARGVRGRRHRCVRRRGRRRRPDRARRRVQRRARHSGPGGWASSSPARSARPASPRWCSRSRSSGSSGSSATAAAVAATVRGVYLLTLACYLVLYLVGWTRGRAIFLAGALLFFASWLTFEVAGSDSNSVIPFQSEVSSGSSNTGLRPRHRHHRVVEHERHHRLRPPRPRSSSGSRSSPWARCSTGASSRARPLRSSPSARWKRSSVRWCSAATRACSWAACSRSRRARSSASSARVATVDARPPGSACSWCSVGWSRCSSTSRPTARGVSVAIALGFAVGLCLIAWWLAPVLGEPDDGDDRPMDPGPTPPGGDILPLPEEAAA